MNRRMGDTRRSRAIEEVRRWSSVILVVLVVVLGYQVTLLRDRVDTLENTATRIEQSSTRTEASADELVAFVHEIQQQTPCGPATGSTTTPCQPDRSSQAVQLVLNVLCASSDPVRIKACADLTKPGG